MNRLIKQLILLLDNQRKVFRLFALGALLFFIGLGIVQGADQVMEPNLKQEVYVLVGLCIGALGFCIAISAQILLIIYRFKNMGNGD